MTTNESNVQFVALNSTHVIYTKLLFIKTDESSVALQLDLYSLIDAHDQPPINQQTGKAQLIVDDAQWTPDGQFVVFVLKGNTTNQAQSQFQQMHGVLCILPRMANQLLRIINPTRFNLPKQLKQGNSQKKGLKDLESQNQEDEDNYQKFVQLIVQDIVKQKKKTQDSVWQNFQNKWQLNIKEENLLQNFKINSQNKDLNDDQIYLSLFLSNGGEITYEFQMNYQAINTTDQAIKLFETNDLKSQQNQKKQKYLSPRNQEKSNKSINDKNSLEFLRFCITHPEISSSQLFLSKIPEFLEKILPLQYTEKISDLYDKDLKQLYELKKQRKAQKQNNINSQESETKIHDEGESKARIQMIGNSIFNGNNNLEINFQQMFMNKQNEKFESVKVVSALQKVINFCRWADMSASGHQSSTSLQKMSFFTLNFKQWLITIVQDCFMILLQFGEPHLALFSLKIAENYFASKNDPSEYYLQKKVGSFISESNEQQNNNINYEQTLQLEMHQIFLNSVKTFNHIINSVKDPQGEMYFQSSCEHRKQTEINLFQDIVPINYPTNFYLNVNDQFETQCMPAYNIIFQNDQRYKQGPFSLNLPIIDTSSTNIQLFSLRNLFQNQYMLLIYYCMIQFRNYQSKNFNILFLVMASFINQRQLDPSFLRDFQEMMNILRMNYLQNERTSETEMFLGATDQFSKFNKVRQSWSDDLSQQFYRIVKFITIFNKSINFINTSQHFSFEQIEIANQKLSQVIQKKLHNKNENYQILKQLWQYTANDYSNVIHEIFQDQQNLFYNEQQKKIFDQNHQTRILQQFIISDLDVINFYNDLQSFQLFKDDEIIIQHPVLQHIEKLINKFLTFKNKILQMIKGCYYQLSNKQEQIIDKLSSSEYSKSSSNSISSESSYQNDEKKNFTVKDLNKNKENLQEKIELQKQQLEQSAVIKNYSMNNSTIINQQNSIKIPLINLFKQNEGQIPLYTLDKLYLINLKNLNKCINGFIHLYHTHKDLSKIKIKQTEQYLLIKQFIKQTMIDLSTEAGELQSRKTIETNNIDIIRPLISIGIEVQMKKNVLNIDQFDLIIGKISKQLKQQLTHRLYLILEKFEIEQKILIQEYQYITKKILIDTKIENKQTCEQFKQEIILRSIEIINLIQVFISLQANSASSSMHIAQEDLENNLQHQLEQFDNLKPVLRNCITDIQSKLINYIYWKIIAFFNQIEKDNITYSNFKIQLIEEEFKNIKKIFLQSKKVWFTNINELCAKIRIKSIHDSLLEEFKDLRIELHNNLNIIDYNNQNISDSFESVIDLQQKLFKSEKKVENIVVKLQKIWNNIPNALQKNLIVRQSRQNYLRLHQTLKYIHLKMLKFWGIEQNLIIQNSLDFQKNIQNEFGQIDKQQIDIFIMFQNIETNDEKLFEEYPLSKFVIQNIFNIELKYIFLLFEVFKKENKKKNNEKLNQFINLKLLKQFLFDFELILICALNLNKLHDKKQHELQKKPSFIDKDEFTQLFDNDTFQQKNPIGKIFQKMQMNLENDENYIEQFYKQNIHQFNNDQMTNFFNLFLCLIKQQINRYKTWEIGYVNDKDDQNKKNIQNEIELINQMCKQLQFGEIDSKIDKNFKEYDEEAQIFYTQFKNNQNNYQTDNQPQMFKIIDIQTSISQILTLLQKLVQWASQYFFEDNLNENAIDGVNNSFVKDIVFILLRLKTVKNINDDNKLLIWNLTTEVQKINDLNNQNIQKLVYVTKLIMKPQKNFNNDIKNLQKFNQEIFNTQLTNFDIFQNDICEIHNQKYPIIQEKENEKQQTEQEIFLEIIEALLDQNEQRQQPLLSNINQKIIKKMIDFEEYLLSEKEQTRQQIRIDYNNLLYYCPNLGHSQLLINLTSQNDQKIPRMHEYALCLHQIVTLQNEDEKFDAEEGVIIEDKKISKICQNIKYPYQPKSPFDTFLKAYYYNQIQIYN